MKKIKIINKANFAKIKNFYSWNTSWRKQSYKPENGRKYSIMYILRNYLYLDFIKNCTNTTKLTNKNDKDLYRHQEIYKW